VSPVARAPRRPRKKGADRPGGEEKLYSEMAALEDDRSRRRFLARHPALVTAETVARLSEIVLVKCRVDVTQAMALAEAAELIGRQVRSPEALARGLRAKGNALHSVNDYAGAVQHHDEAARLFAKAGQPTEVGRTLSTSIQSHILLGEYPRAQAGNDEGIAVALGNIAMCLISLNDFPRALETHQRARVFCEQHGMLRQVALADYNIAYLYYFRGQYGRAIDALKATRDASHGLGNAYVASLCLLDLAEIYLELNLSADASEMAAQAMAGFRKLRIGYEAAKALAYLAIAHGQQGKVLRALELCAEARVLFIAEQNSVWPALLDLYQALILFGAGRLFESRRHCVAALESFRSPTLASKAILCRLLLARLALRMNDIDAARAECDAAQAGLSTLDLPALGFQLHYVKGQIEQVAGQPARAFEAFQQAQTFLETLRSSLRGEELKIAFMKNKLEVYEGLVDLSLTRTGDEGGIRQAFAYVEQAKSRSLQELLLRAATPVVSHAGKSELVRRVSDLREELNWYYHRIEAEQLVAEEHTAERIEGLQSEVRAHESELLRVLREMPAAESESLEMLAPVSLPLEEIRRTLPADAMIVEYFRIGSRLLAFLVSRDRLEVVPVALVARVQHILRLLQFQLAWARPGSAEHSPVSREPSLAATQSHLSDLYRELIAPLRSRMDAAHLIFVPHSLLHYVPFHALYDGQRHLIDSFSISYAPSATIYALCQRRAPTTDATSLVLGVPDAQTPFILDEARAVAARLPGAELYAGAEATAAVLRERGAGRRFLHIAAHGFFRPDNPMFSGIRLGDSYLTLYDLYNLKLPVELVTLSACVTGLNVIAAGDELLGLARGLFRAGAASLLLTLWEVPDQSTAEFMTGFYDRVVTAHNRAAALRDAVLELRERHPHPLHWAPFVLMGKAFAE
jgi:CHAT domain-containing protein